MKKVTLWHYTTFREFWFPLSIELQFGSKTKFIDIHFINQRFIIGIWADEDLEPISSGEAKTEEHTVSDGI